MRPLQSRLLARLDAALAAARNPIEAACLRAEQAGFLARHGQFDEARAAIESLRTQFDPHPVPELSVRLCLAEGWMLHFGSLSADARDKMLRAQALSAATGLAQLQALSSAWLAHLDYNDDQIESMLHNVALALRLAAPDNHAARARACMVLAMAYHFVERVDEAQPWYVRAREHAAAEGDDTTLSAINYNITIHRADLAMQAALFGGDAQGHARQALAGAEATGNFDEWIGTTSLHALVPMQHAGIASVQGRYGEALALYEQHFDAAQQQGLGRLGPKFLADMAWCRWHLGDAAGARRDANAAAHIDSSTHADDRAVAHGRLAALFKLLGDDATAQQHAVLAQACWATHRAFQRSISDALDAAALRP